MCKKWVGLFLLVMLAACSSDDPGEENPVEQVSLTLETAVDGRDVIIDNVIACAASNEDPSVVSIFLYPRTGVTNINFYQTSNADVDKNEYSNYTLGVAEPLDVFNGFLLKYEISPEQEQWVIVTFEEDGAVHLSNPIRLKHVTRPTEYLDENVNVDAGTVMPTFTWEDGTFDDSVIYFHVVSDVADNLFSGTYTFDRQFQYYNLENVVLNVTEVVPPPALEEHVTYNFSLLAVSEDNWVNLFSEVPFTILP